MTDIKLPPLPVLITWSYTGVQMQAYATAAVELDREQRVEPVAKVKAHKTGGNAGITWSAVPVTDYDSMPIMEDGELLYAAPHRIRNTGNPHE